MDTLIVALLLAPDNIIEQLSNLGITLMNNKPNYLVKANQDILIEILQLPQAKIHIIMTPMPECVKKWISAYR